MSKLTDFFKRKNNPAAFRLLALSAMFWGLVGALTVHVAETSSLPHISFILLASLTALCTGICFALVMDIGAKDFIAALLTRPEYKKAMGYLLKRTASYSYMLWLVIGFYYLENKMAGVIAFEINPILVVVLSYTLYAKTFSRRENPWYMALLLSIAALGLVLFFVGKDGANLRDLHLSYSREHLIGMLFIAMGAITVCFHTIYGTLLTNECNRVDSGMSLAYIGFFHENFRAVA